MKKKINGIAPTNLESFTINHIKNEKNENCLLIIGNDYTLNINQFFVLNIDQVRSTK